MNSKIKNYVDVLFNNVPMTRKAAELKEEILSTMNEHFDAHIAEGKDENLAYTEALADMGDIDNLLESLAPEKELKTKIEEYRQKKAKSTAIAVMLYIFGVIVQCAPPAICAVFKIGNEDKAGVIGFICMMLFAAVATGLLIYTRMSVPQDVEPYLVKKKESFNTSSPEERKWAAISKIFWLLVTTIYLAISFLTGAWYITWLTWLIASAAWQAIQIFGGAKADDNGAKADANGAE
ncbi:MAG: permease prefix domain 1-containing protein [Treponema sp.]|nr:permease prefix domain 1-containing protein [Treponema sp.]